MLNNFRNTKLHFAKHKKKIDVRHPLHNKKQFSWLVEIQDVLITVVIW